MQIADIDSAVIVVTQVARMTTIDDNPIPALATIHGMRRNKITPQMLRRVGNNTPLIHPSLTTFLLLLASMVSISEMLRTGSAVFDASYKNKSIKSIKNSTR